MYNSEGYGWEISALEVELLVSDLRATYGVGHVADPGSEDGWLLHIFLVLVYNSLLLGQCCYKPH